MHTKKRRFEPCVIERLFAEPQRFDYFQAVRMLELWLKRNGVPQEGAVANFLRFQNSVSLGFPASQIEALQPEPRELARDAGSLGAALARAELKYIRITPAFMGMLGMTGSLPTHYTERIAAHQLVARDEGPRAFLDTFSNRALALFYEAWRKYRLELKYQPGDKDGFLPLLLSLAGLGHTSLRQRQAGDGSLDGLHDGLHDDSLGYFCGALLQRPTSAGSIARVLSEYFGVPVSMEQFVGGWYGLPLAQQSTLGGANALLGASAVVGARAWQRDLRLRLTVGPLDRGSFASFLPGGKAARVLAKLLTMFTGVTLEYEIELVLVAADVEPISLGSKRCCGRLGWDSFLGETAGARDRHDVSYAIHAI
jgi:type VI secretion system protein ImpH